MAAMNCQRCGSGDPLLTPALVELRGYVFARLCHVCRTEWADFAVADADTTMQDLTLLARYEHYRSLAAAGQPVDYGDWLAYQQAREANERAARKLALEFIKPIARPE